MWRIGWAPNSIPIYIQQDATLHSLFISGNCSTCFGWYFHLSPGAHTTVSTASGICHTVTAICRYRGRVGTGLSVRQVGHLRELYKDARSEKYKIYNATIITLGLSRSRLFLLNENTAWKTGLRMFDNKLLWWIMGHEIEKGRGRRRK
jgi:hypothetical protein